VKTSALIVSAPSTISLGEVTLPRPDPGEVLVRSAFSTISPGTELRCLNNRSGTEVPSYPYVPGYSMSGVVEFAGPETGFTAGDFVFCGGTDRCSIARQWGGHIGRALRAADKLIRLPAGLDLRSASLGKIAGIAAHGLRLLGDVAGQKVAVVGGGLIGQLSARLFQAAGASVCLGDINPSRVEAARRDGLVAVNTADGLLEAFRLAGYGQVEIIVDATGLSRLIPEILQLAKDKPWDEFPTRGARYLIQGSYSGNFEVPYNEAFLKEVIFFIPRDNYLSDIQYAFDQMVSGKLEVSNLLGPLLEPGQAPAFYRELQESSTAPLTGTFSWARF
jgi:3-hydroxyethyl bacteriochlorophyllide a dehydrogenase